MRSYRPHYGFPQTLCVLLCSLLLGACQSAAPGSPGLSNGTHSHGTPTSDAGGNSHGNSHGTATSPTPNQRRADGTPTAGPGGPAARDFSGHWEKNYQLSDDFGARLALYVADIQRRYHAPSARGDFGANTSNAAINGLARFTEELTRMPTLAIRQNGSGVNVEREQDFTLRCDYGMEGAVSSRNAFGVDACGWNGQRLIFTMQLAGGLSISHQFSLSADGEMLDLTTTVASDAVAAPLTVRNLYRRYTPPPDPYNCILTLTRSRVCNQRGAQP